MGVPTETLLFEYCSVVWASAAPTHLNMLNRVFISARFMLRQNISLDHRRNVAALCIFFKIFNHPEHPMHARLPAPANFVRRTRRNQRLNSRSLRSALSPNSVQFNRTFIPSTIEVWNSLPQALVDAATMDSFKRGVNRHLLLWRSYKCVWCFSLCILSFLISFFLGL